MLLALEKDLFFLMHREQKWLLPSCEIKGMPQQMHKGPVINRMPASHLGHKPPVAVYPAQIGHKGGRRRFKNADNIDNIESLEF